MPTPPFLLTTAQMRRLSPHFPLSQGIARVDDRRVSVRRWLRRRRLDAVQAASGRRFQGARLPMPLIGWSAMRSRRTRR
jgi:hypothetical protein